MCSSKYKVPKKFPITFHNRSNYDYHFTIKKLAEEFKKQFTSLGEKTEKYITFTASIKKELLEFVKIERKLQKIYYADYNLLIAQNLWQ